MRLATCLAGAPLNLPVMRLVQQAMLPGSRPSVLAEVLPLRSTAASHPGVRAGDLHGRRRVRLPAGVHDRLLLRLPPQGQARRAREGLGLRLGPARFAGGLPCVPHRGRTRRPAFGWQTVTIDDREKVWFGTPRPVRNQARAAARSHRNPLLVVPGGDAWSPPPGSRVVVGAPHVDGQPLHRTELTGTHTVLVIPDGDGWKPRPGTEGEFARVAVPGELGRYRLLTGIVIAETARQLGIRTARTPRPPRRGLSYGSVLGQTAPPETDLVQPWQLTEY